MGARLWQHGWVSLRLVAAAVLFFMPAVARAQQQGSAPPPATVDPRDAADRRRSLVEPDFTRVPGRHNGRPRLEHAAGRIKHAPAADAGHLRGGVVDAPRERLPPWRLVKDVWHREAAARARLSTERVELARHDGVRDGAWREQQSRLVPRVQHLPQVLLIRLHQLPTNSAASIHRRVHVEVVAGRVVEYSLGDSRSRHRR